MLGLLNDWDALRALESLEPPSLSLHFTQDDLSKLPTFGEIPIIFDLGVFSDAANLSDSIECHSVDAARVTSITCAGLSIRSGGTFGPSRSHSPPPEQDVEVDLEASYYGSDTPATPSTVASVYSTSTMQFLSPDRCMDKAIRRVNSATSLSTSSSFLAAQNLSSCVQARSMTSLALLATSLSVCSMPMPGKSFRRTRSKSSDVLYDKAKQSQAERGASPSSLLDPSCSWSTVSVSPGFLSPSPSYVDTTQQAKTQDPRPGAIPRSPNIARLPIQHANLHDRKLSQVMNALSYTPSPGKSDLPKSPLMSPHSASDSFAFPSTLAWLTSTTLSLTIDQETFRSAHPRFRVSGYKPSKDGRGTSIPEVLTSGVVEFLPVKRYCFAFHHAALESMPVIRHLALLEDDPKDYLGREANLCIKKNGAYTVIGAELNDLGATGVTPHTTPRLHPRHLKYHWRFEYSVEDRKDSLGRIIDGEKALIPESFACNPGLLHPIYGTGKKYTFVQQVRKTLTGRLTSKRIRDSSPSAGVGHSPDRRNQHQQTGTPVVHTAVRPDPEIDDGDNSAKASHRRFYSATAAVAVPALAMVNARAPNEASGPYMRRNRAASIADFPASPPPRPLSTEYFPGICPGRTGAQSPTKERRKSLTSPAFKVVRHIVPPSELDEQISGPGTMSHRRTPSLRDALARPLSPASTLTKTTALSPHIRQGHDGHRRNRSNPMPPQPRPLPIWKH